MVEQCKGRGDHKVRLHNIAKRSKKCAIVDAFVGGNDLVSRGEPEESQ